jgi:glucose-6-phosphate isomerase
MEPIKLNITQALNFLPEDEFDKQRDLALEKLKLLHEKTGAGNDFLGWLNLPSAINDKQTGEIIAVANELRNEVDVVVVVGIGGSYLGAKAVIEALNHSFDQLLTTRKAPLIMFAGQNLSQDYLSDLLEVIDDKNYGIVVISKSGTTTEPALAFRMLKNHLESKIGKKQAGKRIIAITDRKKGALKQLANEEGYKTFVIPDDIGGRYSVLTPVGLLPVALAGISINDLIEGARFMEKITGQDITPEGNPAVQYSIIRNLLYRHGRKIEILVNFNPKLHFFAEWWKQLYGESEGKEGKGIYPSSVDFTTDLHSLGQYIQEGERMLFETVISVTNPVKQLNIPHDKNNLDKLNYLAGKSLDEVNKMAELGTMLAHVDGGVPNIHIEIPSLNEFCLGQLIYFFEKTCAISGYLLGVNPFNQPGVEAYKKNMFALLGKPGFEEESVRIRKNIVS